MNYRLAKSRKGLREGNIVLQDNVVFPPNFICAQYVFIDDDETFPNESTINVAFVNATKEVIAQALTWDPSQKLQAEVWSTDDDGFEKVWQVSYHGTCELIRYLHELQNFYQDVTGFMLMPPATKEPTS